MKPLNLLTAKKSHIAFFFITILSVLLLSKPNISYSTHQIPQSTNAQQPHFEPKDENQKEKRNLDIMNQDLQSYVANFNFLGYTLQENTNILDYNAKIVGDLHILSFISTNFPLAQVRFIFKNSIVTMEYREDRVNIMLNENNVIIRITVG